LIDQIELLQRLFENVIIPTAVRQELDHAETPTSVRRWITNPPPWLAVLDVPPDSQARASTAVDLDEGEAQAIRLAASANAELILMDDRAGVSVARTQGFTVMGTLGVLDLAARRDMIDLADALERLRATNFRCRPALMNDLLARYEADQVRL
jgi:predicted nucleic acid-binding protein